MSEGRLKVPKLAVAETLAHLRAKGREGHEGVVLWIGTFDPPEIIGTIVPEQETGPGRFVVSLTERQRIARELAGTGNVLVAQVHSHPGLAFHSPIDDEEAIPKRAGSYSLVVPDFADDDDLLRGAALFQFSPAGTWDEIPVTTFEIEQLGTAPVTVPETERKEGILAWLIGKMRSVGRSNT